MLCLIVWIHGPLDGKRLPAPQTFPYGKGVCLISLPPVEHKNFVF